MVSTPEAILCAYEHGVNFFFVSADMHWPYYEHTRRGIEALLEGHPERRSQIVVAATSYLGQPDFCWMPFIEVVEAIPGLEYLDITVAGGAYGYEFSERRLKTYESHLARRHVGIRAIGASFHDRVAARDAIVAESVDIAFARYNPAHSGAREDLFPFLERSQSRTLLYTFTSASGWRSAPRRIETPNGKSRTYPDPTDFYRFALSSRAVDGILCSPSTPGEIEELDAALARGPLSRDEEEYFSGIISSSQRNAKPS
jgi:hypothetical protein